MGGFYGQVTGRTKIATWLAFKREIADAGLATQSEQEAAGMCLELPRNKRQGYRQMSKLPDGSGWRLRYHFHS